MKPYIQHLPIIKKMGLRLIVLLSGLFILGLQDANATHLVGGNLTYRCLGNNLYEIRLTVRRDCLTGAQNAQFDDPASIGFFDAVTNQLLTFPGVPDGQILVPLNNNDTLNEILVSDCSVIAGDVCVHTTTYIATVALPYHANGYLIAYQRCCRNGTLNNVLDPLNTGMTLAAELSAFAQTECNSSPQFRAFPPIYTCVNKELVFDHSAIDPEGDSLVYSLCTPNAGATNSMNQPQPPFPPPFPPVVYRPPYNLANIMGGVPLVINPSTGELRGIPNTIGQFVVGICVEAYKNGQLTGITRRDFQFNVRSCRDVPVALFEAPDLTCNNLTINFDNQSQLADEYTWIFNYGDSLNQVRDTTFEPSFTFPSGNFFQVALIANDADSFCLDTIVQTIGVFDSQINAAFTHDVSDCSEDGVVLDIHDQSTGFDPGFPAVEWEWLVTVCQNVYPNTGPDPIFPPIDLDEPCTALVTLIVTASNGCTDSAVESFPVQEIVLPFNPDADSICKGETVQLLVGADDGLQYIWEPNNGIDTMTAPCAPYNPCVYPGISVTYYVTVTDGLCEVTDSVHVGVQQLPTLAFKDTTDCKSLTVLFDNGSLNADSLHWDFGDGDTLVTANIDVTHTYDSAGTYVVTLSSRDGCDVSISKTITANALTSTVDDNTVNCFFDSIALNPGYNPVLTYMWSPAGLLDSANSQNPLAGVEDDTTFYVTITQAGLEGCEIYDSIRVLVPDDFTVTAPDDKVSCRFETLELAVVVTGNTNLDYVWINSNNDIIGFDSVLHFVTGGPSDTLTVTATDSLGCSHSDQVVVFNVPPDFTVETCFDTMSYCNIQTITLCAESIAGVTFEWFNTDTLLIGTGDSIEVTPGTPTCYRVLATEPLGCQVDDIVCLTPTFFDLDITNTQNICLGETVEICVTDHNNQNLDYLWSPTADNTGCITVSPTDTTTYTVTVTNSQVGCRDTLSADVVVSLFEPINVTITASEDTIFFTESTQLFVNQDAGFDYEWSASNGPAPGNEWNPVVTPPAGGITYTVTVTNDAGCTATASITIQVRNPPCDDSTVFLPNAFSPNDDGVNDLLYVRSIFMLDMDLHIYNRWGQEVFSTTDQNTPWDGRFNGERLHPDVFGFYLNVTCPNEEKFFKKGNITILD